MKRKKAKKVLPPKPNGPGVYRRWWLRAAGLAIALFLGFRLFANQTNQAKDAAISSPAVAATTSFKQPTTFEDLLAIPTKDLGQVDIARMNLLCMQGLPDSDEIDIPQCLATLDDWAAKIRQQTEVYHYQYTRNTAKFANSENQFRMMMLMSTLGDDLGVTYDARHPNSEPNASFFAKIDTISIHEILGPRRCGTCASLPIVVVALCNRLGYPVKLVHTPTHAFVRWDDGSERFNIETTRLGGLGTNPDEKYRDAHGGLTDEAIAAEGYLQSMTPAQALADCLETRIYFLGLHHVPQKDLNPLLEKCVQLTPTTKMWRPRPLKPETP